MTGVEQRDYDKLLVLMFTIFKFTTGLFVEQLHLTSVPVPPEHDHTPALCRSIKVMSSV